MDPINNLNNVVYVLREKLAQKSSRNGKTARARQTGGLGTDNRATTAELQQALGARLSALAKHPENDEQAVLTFIEVTLAWEFGEEILQDVGLDALKNEIAGVLKSDPDVYRRLVKVLRELPR